MFNTKLFKHSFILLVIIAVLFQISETLYLSWTFWWFDVVLHFLGGFWVGMSLLLIWSFYFAPPTTSRLKTLTIVFVGVALIGVAWEMFEVYFGVTTLSDSVYWSDTFSDLVMDVCGGILGSLYSIKLLSKDGQ